MGKPYLPNLEPIIAAGVDPRTGLPMKMGAGTPCLLKENIKYRGKILKQNTSNQNLALD